MSNKLMIITISGVQEIISKSRKTVDFYNNSQVIVKFLKQLYKIMKYKNEYTKDFELVFPSKMKEEEYDTPNYFIAKINSNEENENLEDEIRKVLKEKIEENMVNIDANVYIVIVDYNECYEKTYELLKKKLDGYKNNKFKDYSLKAHKNKKEENKIKNINILNCTICGVKKGKHISKNTKLNKLKLQGCIEEKFVMEDEVLCDECFERRKMDLSYKNYPSTLDISVIEWIEKLKEIDGGKSLEKYNNKVNKKFPGKCISNFYHLEYLNSNKKIYNDFIKELESLNKLKQSGVKASRYYALIKADIDDLGKHFSGKYFDRDCDLQEFQQNLSIQISTFARKIKDKIEEDFDKKLYIYLGGDDLLFFCPLYRIFEEIEFIDKKIKEIKVDNYNKKITISKSIVVAHDSTPLSQVIDLSRTSLEQAKEKFKNNNKNALAISLINSSSTVRTSYLQNKYENICVIKNLINEFKTNISSSFISQLERQLFLIGENMELEEYEVLMNVVINSIKRIGMRKIKNMKKENIEYFVNLILEFVYIESNNYFVDFKNYFNLLHMSEKYSREIIEKLEVEEYYE